MTELFFKRLAKDLLTLEINTIIKSDMSAAKMPISRRQALYVLAGEYSAKLEEFGVRDPVYWTYGGMRSFGELRDRAKDGIAEFNERLKNLSQDEQPGMREKITMLERIQYQSSQIVGMFKILQENAMHRTGHVEPPEPLKKEDRLKMENMKPAESHLKSELWNNDIDRQRMNEIDDLDLDADLVTLIRKAWEIGTEKIVLQTVIQLDGDVTTRISESLAKTPNETIFQIHNESIETSTKFWSDLVKALGEMAGKISGLLSGKL